MTKLNIHQVYELPYTEYLHYTKYLIDKVKHDNRMKEKERLLRIAKNGKI